MAYICRMPTYPKHHRSQLVQPLRCNNATLRYFGSAYRSILVPLGTRYGANRPAAFVRYVGCLTAIKAGVDSSNQMIRRLMWLMVPIVFVAL